MRILVGIFIFSFCWTAQAQKLGDFTLQDARDGKSFKLTDIKSDKGLVMIFFSNECPFAEFYESRIIDLEGEYRGKGIDFILVNAHQEEEENFDAMKVVSQQKYSSMPYLADKEKVLAKMVGATRSPEVFLFKRDKGNLSVYYKGAIDNNPQVAEDIKEHYLKDNLENLLQNKPAEHAGTRPAGCRIK